MGDYLRDRFPLASTCTVYMDGTSRYNLVRFDRPGIIAPVTLTREQADAFCDAVRTARAEPCDEGAEAMEQHWAYGNDEPSNPYRVGGAS